MLNPVTWYVEAAQRWAWKGVSVLALVTSVAAIAVVYSDLFASAIGSLPEPLTFVAISSAVLGITCVSFVIRMTLSAVRFPSIYCGQSTATKDVNPRRNRVKMRGIYTETVAAEVINDHAFGDAPNQRLVGKSVGWRAFAVRHRKRAITFVSNLGLPNPARIGLLHFRPEPISDGWTGVYSGRHRNLLSVSMRSGADTSRPLFIGEILP